MSNLNRYSVTPPHQLLVELPLTITGEYDALLMASVIRRKGICNSNNNPLLELQRHHVLAYRCP